MPRITLLVALAVPLAACASLDTGPVPTRAVDFKSSAIRQPAIYVRFAFGQGQWSERERASLPRDYEGALLEGLNAKAVLAKDVQLVAGTDSRFDGRAALARARALGADHAILVDARLGQEVASFCTETKRPLRGTATVLSQEVEVLRASDGAARLRLIRGPALAVTDVDVDCDNPRQSGRRSTDEMLSAAVEKILFRVFGP